MLLQFTTYKAARRGQLVITVPAQRSSQECAHCGYTHPDNRRTQAEFVCLRCGHIANADENAGTVIQQRGVALVLSQALKRKAKKKTGSKIRKAARPVTDHTTPAGTRGSARGETVGRQMGEALLGAVSLSREPVKSTLTGQPVQRENQETAG